MMKDDQDPYWMINQDREPKNTVGTPVAPPVTPDPGAWDPGNPPPYLPPPPPLTPQEPDPTINWNPPAPPVSASDFGTGDPSSRSGGGGGVTVEPSPSSSPTQPPATSFNMGGDANNQFGGQTYAGFDPQNHQGANLNDPMNAKYALQQYLANNGGLTGGANGNAAAQAAALNKLYGGSYGNSNFFTAVDAETIMMPDGQYVHFAPNGYGMAKGTYNPNAGSEVFWGATGSPFSGAPGSGVPSQGGGAVTSPSSSGGNNQQLAQLIAGLGKNLTPQGNAGPNAGPLNQANQDPFSQLIAGGYGSMIGSGGVGIAPLNVDLQNSLRELVTGRNPSAGGGLPALQGARSQFDASHSAMRSSAEADLANRGLMSMPGSTQGPETTAIDYIMRQLAPSFDNAMSSFLSSAYGQAGSMAQNNNANFLAGLSGAGNYQNQIAQIAIQTLAQNNQFNEFVAQFGLDRDKALYDIASGQNTGLANLLAQFLASVNTSSGGHV